MLLDVRPDHLKIVQDILQRLVPDREVWAFGSRAKWLAKEYSDLDLCVLGDAPLGFSTLGLLEEAFDESDLPYKVDVVDWATTSEAFRKIIERDKVVLQKGRTSEKVLRFGDYATLVKESVNPSDTPSAIYVGLEHIDQGSLTLNGFGYAQDVDSQKLRFKTGDVLFGKLRPYFRKVVVAPFDGVCSTDIWVVRPKVGRDRNFLFYWMAMPEFVERATQASEGTRMPRAKWEYVSEFALPAISATLQIEIGKTLRSFDDKISILRETNATLEAIAQAIFKSWFVDFDPVRAKMEGREPEGMDAETAALFPDSFEDSELGEIPRGWATRRVGDVLELAYGKALKATDRIAGQVPVYGSGGVTGYHNQSLVNGPSVIVGRKGTVGSLYWEDNPFYPIDTVFYVKPVAVPLTYCYYLLQTFGLNEMNTDAAVPGLNRENVYRLLLSLPPDGTLHAFDNIIGSLREQMFNGASQMRYLADLRDTLLPRLMSGKISLTTSPYEEVAA